MLHFSLLLDYDNNTVYYSIEWLTPSCGRSFTFSSHIIMFKRNDALLQALSLARVGNNRCTLRDRKKRVFFINNSKIMHTVYYSTCTGTRCTVLLHTPNRTKARAKDTFALFPISRNLVFGLLVPLYQVQVPVLVYICTMNYSSSFGFGLRVFLFHRMACSKMGLHVKKRDPWYYNIYIIWSNFLNQ